MNFQQLHYILALDEHRHFGQAAKSCNVSQATLSAMVKKLEEELDVILFDRTHNPVIATETGKKVIQKARQILSLQGQILDIHQQPLTALHGKLVLGIIPTVANSLLPVILPVILKENPELQLQVEELTTDEIRRQLISGQLDMGILATPLSDELLDENILYYEPMLVYGLHTSKKYVEQEDTLHKKVWLLREGHCFRNQTMAICDLDSQDDSSSNLRFSGNTFDTMISLTDSLGGITLVPELYYRQMSHQKKQKTKPFPRPIPVREISLVTYRPFVRSHTVAFLSNRIKTLVKPHLSTSSYQNKDLSIIGI